MIGNAFAATFYQSAPPVHRFYAGLTTGYGSTTWGGLVPSKSQQSVALELSTPTSVNEGGMIWGAVAGYEFTPSFATEFSWTRYPSALVMFDPMSLFTFENDGLTAFRTQTETYSLSGKLMIDLFATAAKLFSSIGVAELHRYDMMTDRWRVSPTFSAGVDYPLTSRIFAEAGLSYTGGYGESELDPAEDYVPFLYAGYLRILVRV